MSVLTLADAKTHLNITSATYDTELQTIIDAAEAVIAKRVGPLAPTTVTSVVDGGWDTLALPCTPVISVTSVTPLNATALDVSQLTVSSGLVTYQYAGWFGARSYTVVYQAGRSTLPSDLLMAIKEMVRHLWKTQRGSTAKPGSGDTPSTPGFLVPYAVAELIEPHVQVGT